MATDCIGPTDSRENQVDSREKKKKRNPTQVETKNSNRIQPKPNPTRGQNSDRNHPSAAQPGTLCSSGWVSTAVHRQSSRAGACFVTESGDELKSSAPETVTSRSTLAPESRRFPACRSIPERLYAGFFDEGLQYVCQLLVLHFSHLGRLYGPWALRSRSDEAEGPIMGHSRL